MVIKVQDRIQVNSDERVAINLGAERYTTRQHTDKLEVAYSDSFQVVPFAKRINVDYTMPSSMLDGFITDIDALRADILQEIGAREVAIIDSTSYNKTYVDGKVKQTYLDVKANYIGNEQAKAYILDTEIADMEITYDTGSGTTVATFQGLNDTVVSVENSQASYTEDLQIVVDNVSDNAEYTTTLAAEVGGIAASVISTEGVSTGTMHTWDGDEVLKIGYLYDFDGVTMQYLGGMLGDNNDGWVLYSATIAVNLQDTTDTANEAHGWAAGASKLITDPSTDAITGWSFGDGSGVASEFKINANQFIVSNGDNSHQPFTIDTTTGKSQFNGVVSFTNTNMDAYSNSNVPVVDTSNLANKDMSNVTTIDGGKITTGKVQSADGNTYFDLTNNQIKMSNTGTGFVLDSNAKGTEASPNIKGSYIKGAYIKGGNIESVNLKSSTIRVKDLIVLTDGGKQTSTKVNKRSVISDKSMTFDIAHYKSNSNKKNLVSSLSGNQIQFSGATSAVDSWFDNYDNLQYTYSSSHGGDIVIGELPHYGDGYPTVEISIDGSSYRTVSKDSSFTYHGITIYRVTATGTTGETTFEHLYIKAFLNLDNYTNEKLVISFQVRNHDNNADDTLSLYNSTIEVYNL